MTFKNKFRIKDEIEYKIPESPLIYMKKLFILICYISYFRPIIIINAKAYMKLMDKYPFEDVFIHYLCTQFFDQRTSEN